MDLLALQELLSSASSLVELDELVEEYESKIILALLNAEVTTPEGLKLLEATYGAFTTSGAGRYWLRNNTVSNGVGLLLQMFALAYEKSNAYAKIRTIAAHLPPSSVQIRLKALSKIYTEIGFDKKDYLNYFGIILDLLSSAQYDENEPDADYTGYVLRILHIYKSRGEESLSTISSYLLEFQQLFTHETNIEKWPLLKRYSPPSGGILDITHGFDSAQAEPQPLSPSVVFESLFDSKVSQLLRKDSRTPGGNLSSPLGLTSSYARQYLLEFGTADFRKSFSEYSPADRVLIYCHFNMRKHYFTTYYIYSVFVSKLAPLIYENNKLVFLDLGCGPLTSGLAIADLFVNRFGKPIPMQYIGVDIAPAMLDKARDFATDSTLFSASEFFFLVDFQEVLSLITERIVRSNEAILINASYLFASSSLIVDDLAAFVIQLHTRCPTSPIYFVYQNPVHEDKNAKYQEWKTHLPGLKVVHHAKEPVQYRTRRFGGTSEPETVRYELLTYGS